MFMTVLLKCVNFGRSGKRKMQVRRKARIEKVSTGPNMKQREIDCRC